MALVAVRADFVVMVSDLSLSRLSQNLQTPTGPTYCGNGCTSNCKATATCGQYAAKPGAMCPLNTCCSQYGFCGTSQDFCDDKCQSNCVFHPKPPASEGQVLDKGMPNQPATVLLKLISKSLDIMSPRAPDRLVIRPHPLIYHVSLFVTLQKRDH